MERCEWCLGSELYMDYHDNEWGSPVFDDLVHFEFLVLESAQAGLSWITILKKRENYREAYCGFDPIKVSQFDSADIERLMQNAGIVRNRLKITSSIQNAKIFLAIVEEFGSFAQYVLSFTGGKPIINAWNSLSELPAKTAVSDAISKDLKKRGCKFLGSTIMYSHLQATGMINDHVTSCFRYKALVENKQTVIGGNQNDK